MSKPNRRVFPRADEELKAWYRLDNGQHVKCIAVDIGVQGACLKIEHPLPDFNELEVCFELDLDWHVIARAQPIWQRPEPTGYLVGITYRPRRSADKYLIGPWVHRTRRMKLSNAEGG